MAEKAVEQQCINAIRILSAEGVQKANSGHPGMPMGMAPSAYTLWTKIQRHNPKNPDWLNRDRFVLSAGHGSMLIYSMLHLTGYDLGIEDLQNFRQIGSKTPGHPEYGHSTPGIEVTTGPLGQGIANGVGMAIAEKYLAAKFNKPKFDIFDYNIFAICGDGCLQEGVSHEAASLAGHLGLGKLIVLYDDNSITIDGDTSVSFTEDVVKRFEALDWQVIVLPDGNDIDSIQKAMEQAKAETSKPSLIKIKTTIGFGSPNMAGTEKVHGAPLGAEELKLTKKNLGWDFEKSFYVPDEVYAQMDCCKKGAELETEWQALFDAYKKDFPQEAKLLEDALAGKLDFDVNDIVPAFEAGGAIASRKASQMTIGEFMPKTDLILGGSADLTASNLTNWPGMSDFQKDSPDGRYLRFGVREHAMGAIMNGIAASKILKVYGGTFLVFSDYLRGAMRVASISKHPVTYVYTHDSIGVGEDGPTHQPVEQIASMRSMPGMTVFRPADAYETAYAWQYALNNMEGPVALCLTRQNLPTLEAARTDGVEGIKKGAYVVLKQDKPDVLLLATGSEVSLALDAAVKLAEDNIAAQVVSMPSWELFEKQDQAYRDSIIPPAIRARVGVEAGVDSGWFKYIGLDGKFIGMNSFGISGPNAKCFEYFGITVDAVVAAAKEVSGK